MTRISVKEAANQIETLIRGGHFKNAEAVVKVYPVLEKGAKEYNKRQRAAEAEREKRERAAQPARSGTMMLRR